MGAYGLAKVRSSKASRAVCLTFNHTEAQTESVANLGAAGYSVRSLAPGKHPGAEAFFSAQKLRTLIESHV